MSILKPDDTWVHPEQREGEVFLGNSTAKEFEEDIRYKSKRLGEVAYYHATGKPINFENTNVDKTFPLFVSEEEYRENLEKNKDLLNWCEKGKPS